MHSKLGNPMGEAHIFPALDHTGWLAQISPTNKMQDTSTFAVLSLKMNFNLKFP
jgi:hypothetical protein